MKPLLMAKTMIHNAAPWKNLAVVTIVVMGVVMGLGHQSALADNEPSKERAQKLFGEGVKLREAGKEAEGCAKLRESLELFTVANTLFNVAQCDEGGGRIATALDHWRRGLVLVDDKDPRVKVAKDRIAALEPRVPRVSVVFPKGKDVPTVSLDDVEFSAEALAKPLDLDPGKHVFLVRLEGRQDRRQEIELAERERMEFVATPGAPIAAAAASSSSPVVVPPPLPTTKPIETPPPSNGRRTAGFVVGGVGLAGLVAAGVTGGLLVNQDKVCKTNVNCRSDTDEGKYYQSLVLTNGVAFGVGIAGVGAGLILILTAPKTQNAKQTSVLPFPLILPQGGGMGLSGRF